MADINERIQQSLRAIEQEKQVRILYACESGSRAWGFASEDSDYDVRFLYVRQKNDYLRLNVPRDVIEQPIVDDLDINGWDIFKALRLLRKSNPPLLEWLFSPIIYQENSAHIETLRGVARQAYSSTSVFYHYSRMAYGNYHQYIEQKDEVPLKKYLYVLRPVVALLFLEQHHTLPPTNFIETIAQLHLEQDIQERIQHLVELKQTGGELGLGAPDHILNTFIDEQLAKWKHHSLEQHTEEDGFRTLDDILLHILEENDKV